MYICICEYVSMCLCVYVSVYLSIYLSIYPLIHLSIYMYTNFILSSDLSVYVSMHAACMHTCETTLYTIRMCICI